ncbi:hypothetical protein VOLCADRAFT_76489 [Volvox carteri f. nagariensis]|uniref:Uncharacterized protein n=1 Tax=Volvox carteri f. nagariensis TaxID=3068 RepID=D8U8A3_VOLCA|nr:uncharacterized protein VOLCADRAFT_76489 [Volvox carteri f. nagariensis]EFJ44053.1 hypothetical protein VOLCADRAFT_76489 [Volvox carteri f. nagariensis]|eukprot:XP_002954854.1 hypothetical protein VOLCADRAFT_76489 [Volvox carteri f. nagariensis]
MCVCVHRALRAGGRGALWSLDTNLLHICRCTRANAYLCGCGCLCVCALVEGGGSRTPATGNTHTRAQTHVNGSYTYSRRPIEVILICGILPQNDQPARTSPAHGVCPDQPRWLRIMMFIAVAVLRSPGLDVSGTYTCGWVCVCVSI